MDMIRAIKRLLARRALERSLRPDPQYRANMLAQFSTERRARYERNIKLAMERTGSTQGNECSTRPIR
jgi:hypothetical protein